MISALNLYYIFVLNCLDPRLWSEEHVVCWLNWATKEFSLECNNIEAFSKMRGRDMVALGREGFLAKAPPFTGDILWEHLEILQKGKHFPFILYLLILSFSFSFQKFNLFD